MSEVVSEVVDAPATGRHADTRRRPGFVGLMAAERIKLFSTRSPWWCSALAVVLVVGMTGLVAATGPDGPMPFALTRVFLQFGIVVVMVMATVAVTTEYRFATIRTTFQAVPNRTAAMLAKTVVVAVVAGIVGLVASFGAWGVAYLVRSDASLAITTSGQWRAVAGAALVFAGAGVVAVAVGILLRQTAGAVALLLVWVLLAENLVALIPNVGDDIQRYLPFINANNFLTAGLGEDVGGPGAGASGAAFGPWGSMIYFAAIALALLVISLVVVNRRDA